LLDGRKLAADLPRVVHDRNWVSPHIVRLVIHLSLRELSDFAYLRLLLFHDLSSEFVLIRQVHFLFGALFDHLEVLQVLPVAQAALLLPRSLIALALSQHLLAFVVKEHPVANVVLLPLLIGSSLVVFEAGGCVNGIHLLRRLHLHCLILKLNRCERCILPDVVLVNDRETFLKGLPVHALLLVHVFGLASH